MKVFAPGLIARPQMPRGGKRQGAGRPKLPQTKKRVTISLRPEILARLNGENKNQLIEKLLIEYFEKELNNDQ